MNGPSTSYSLLPISTSPPSDHDSPPAFICTILTNGDDEQVETAAYCNSVSDAKEETIPLRGASDSRLYSASNDSIKPPSTIKNESDSDFLSRQQKPRFWRTRASSQTAPNSSLVVPLPRTRLIAEKESTTPKPTRPRLENQTAICQNNYNPFDACASLAEEDDTKSSVLTVSTSASSPSGFQLANVAGGAVQSQSVITSLVTPASLGASTDFSTSNIQHCYSGQLNEARAGEKTTLDDDQALGEEAEAIDIEPYYGADEATESCLLVDEEKEHPTSNWFSAVKNLTRPSSANVNSAYNGQYRRSFDSLGGENEFVNLISSPGPVYNRRARTGSAIVLDGGMAGNSLLPYAFPRPSDSRKSSAGSRGRKSSLFHYGTRSPQPNLPMQMRRQSAVAFPHRMPPVPFNQSNNPSRMDLDQRKPSTASLVAMTFSNVARPRSPSNQVKTFFLISTWIREIAPCSLGIQFKKIA